MSDLEFATAADGSQVAYRIMSTGHPRWLVWVPGLLYSIESIEDDIPYARFIHGLTEFANVVLVERQGLGSSDMVDFDTDVYEQWADGIVAVLDEIDVATATVAGYAVGAATTAAFGLLHPERAASLVIMFLAATDMSAMQERLNAVVARDADVADVLLAQTTPSRHDDPTYARWNVEAGQRGASPRTAARYWDAALSSRYSVIERLAELQPTTLWVHRHNAMLLSTEDAETYAATIPDCTLRILDGADSIPNAGDVDGLVAAIAEFVTGERHVSTSDRPMMALLFTDLVDSTQAVVRAGDDRWAAVLDRHDDVVQRTLALHGGRLLKTTGDGILASFASASGALAGAADLRAALGELGLTARMGVHVAEVDVRGDDISGLGVHIAARVMGHAGPKEILASEAVAQIALGSSHTFDPHSTVELKGLDGTWNLHRLT